MDRKIIVTGDNSKTLLIPSINETYHSTKGAFNEALHVFIDAGLKKINPNKSIRVFEMGFGTGLNALVTLNHILNEKTEISYTSVEQFPLDYKTVSELNYPALFSNRDELIDYFKLMHEVDWEKEAQIHPRFKLKKIKLNLIEDKINEPLFDLVFYDAFGPKVQPELWDIPVLKKIYEAMSPGGIFVTYCAQGQFKRNIKAVGFEYEALPGPPGKREMTRAIKPV